MVARPLLAAICHDLRAPLAAVTMGTEYVLRTTPEDEASGRSRRVLEAILRSCRQMERLVRDFADLSEIEADAVVLRSGIHDATHMLSLAAEQLRARAVARGVDVALSLPTSESAHRSSVDPLLLRCDDERLLRALGHLVDNAIRFAPEGTAVQLSVEQDAGEVRFLITDRGPGIPEETLANLYDRGWHGRRAERVGAGLGLAIARGIVTAHAGRIDVETEPGRTVFALVIPRAAGDPTEVRES